MMGCIAKKMMNYVGLVGGLENLDYVSIQLGTSYSQLTNFIIFQRGRYTTNYLGVFDPNLLALQCSEKPSSGIPDQHLSTIMGLQQGYDADRFMYISAYLCMTIE